MSITGQDPENGQGKGGVTIRQLPTGVPGFDEILGGFLTYFGVAEFQPLHQRPLLIYAVAAILLGAQMMSIGFLAELITAYLGRDQ